MIVRCGNCRVELDVAGAGEFACPACGTRNVVRAPGAGAGLGAGPGPALDDLGLPDLSGLARAPAAPQSDEPPPGVRWVTCPSCSYRFACGELAEVTCPACSSSLAVDDDGARVL
jgi:predicted RNA-binding Zn-ribbon protein involved in translation (DUF1610 family)